MSRKYPMDAPRMPLTEAESGRRYVVAAVYGGDALAERLHASGLWAGAAVERLATAPFGGPLLFRVHGFRLALRRSEARRVEVTEARA
jgi:Fe2+ transport system protein FeoA